jgi:glutamine synthetase
MRAVLARSIGDWAMQLGATNYAHWYHPNRGLPAEKHDAFLDYDGTFRLPVSRLFRGETDGSSLPSGGLRATHTAAAYSSWDTSSPPFIRGSTLYIPAVVVSHDGHPLDDKLPLLRSQEAINEQGQRLMKALDLTRSIRRVVSNVGCEQEFFLVDIDAYKARPDLVHCGRTLFGAKPHRGQQLEQNYCGAVPPRIRAFLYDVQGELWRLGMMINTFHNEVAPSQHELSPVFTVTSLAADQNELCMEVMREYAAEHGLAVLLHEKPFAGLNGSGKHNNWGLNAYLEKGSGSINLFHPGRSQTESARFVAMVSTVMYALRKHGDLLRVGVATPHNDHRLGAQEAPPAIISLATGKVLESHLRSVINGGDLHGYALRPRWLDTHCGSVEPIEAAPEDRNRTAPFPFCGNRFEFRAVGASQNIAWPLTLLNTAVADGMSALADIAEQRVPVRDAVAKLLRENMDVVFNGNGYEQAWADEAARRGLPNLRTTPAALATLDSPKNRELLSRFKIMSPEVLKARAHMFYHQYAETVAMEAATMSDMLHTGFIPGFQDDVASMHEDFRATNDQRRRLYDEILRATAELDAEIARGKAEAERGVEAHAAHGEKQLLPKMAAVRALVDRAELIMPARHYPYPRYEQILLGHHADGNLGRPA